MKRIACIECDYVRDTQVFEGDPGNIPEDADMFDMYIDVKRPCQFIGIYEGADEGEIKAKAAERFGVHPDIISLYDCGCEQQPGV
jgi:predicted Zn-dependent protease with MMP-like domain